jgi:hypothetical protein
MILYTQNVSLLLEKDTTLPLNVSILWFFLKKSICYNLKCTSTSLKVKDDILLIVLSG